MAYGIEVVDSLSSSWGDDFGLFRGVRWNYRGF